MPCYEIEFPLDHLDTDAVEDALFAGGAVSITYVDRGDEPVLEPRPGEVRLWGDTLVRALYDESVDPAAALSRLAGALGIAITRSARLRRVQSRVWERVWLEDWRPMRFGARLWVCPTGAPDPEAACAGPESAGAGRARPPVVVRLDPGLAFGTGTHPTTALCLEALDALQLTGRRFVDYGCGSGILSVAALLLGARPAIAVDLDPQALLASRENAIRNGVSEWLITQGVDAAIPPADCVVSNILAGTLIELLPVLTGACAPGADLVLSGILSAQCAAVLDAYRASFDILGCERRDDWCCIRARHRTAAGRDGGT
jgi:ribosomal protein L11 methyltransferase